jgi:hypothetical protein
MRHFSSEGACRETGYNSDIILSMVDPLCSLPSSFDNFCNSRGTWVWKGQRAAKKAKKLADAKAIAEAARIEVPAVSSLPQS